MNEELIEGNVADNEETWREHVLTAQNFIGSDVEYCKRNGLNMSTFATYKKKFGFTKPKKIRAARNFVKVEPAVAEEMASPRTPVLKSRVLPDAKWVAEFVIALHSCPK